MKLLAAGFLMTATTLYTVTPASAAPMIDWRPCPHDVAAQCASLRVPVDWARPEGRTIALRLMKLPALAPDRRIGTLFDVPGGPGESGTEALKRPSELHKALRQRFDVVGYDPRTAVALSALPASCTRTWSTLTDPRDHAAYAGQVRALSRGVAACRRDDRTGLLTHLDSISAARDMEAVRRALGETRLTFTVRSYGGVPMTAYARLFPERVRAAYLDGVPDHVDAWTGRGREWLTGTEQAFDRFVSWCAATTACELHGRNVRSLWRRLVRRADAFPVPVLKGAFAGRELTGWHLRISAPVLLLPGVAGDSSWRAFAASVRGALRGDASGFAMPSLGNLRHWTRPVVLALQCPDGLWGRTGYPALRGNRGLLERLSPDFGALSYPNLACTGWTVPLANPPRPLPARRLPPFLGAGTHPGDYTPTRRLLRHIPGSATVRYDGPGHVIYLGGMPGAHCVVEHAVRYLTDLTLPSGAVCRAKK
ncbi:alpha/beta fold hydrolase [Streptosporangium sp. NPDC000239]|uniref:alpha/beta fold hydrolase n=1 Tax=Streptosporangium sp. NPDC000239 TaxID=3154248 RepID=UPI0033304056